MRKLSYDCYTNNVYVKNVKTFKEALAWEEAQDGNEYKESLTEVSRILIDKEI